jgi:hypothetical protein
MVKDVRGTGQVDIGQVSWKQKLFGYWPVLSKDGVGGWFK